MSRSKLFFSQLLLTILFCFNAGTARADSLASSNHPHEKVFESAGKACDLRTAQRKLWEDHVTWTRVYIISAFADLADRDAAAQRLLKNQQDIGDSVKPFYGAAAGNKLAALLRDHILIAVDLITAVKADNKASVETETAKWNENADDIAEFLSKANPNNWPIVDMKAMMREHLNLTTQEVLARAKGDWAADIAAYEKIHMEILQMADALADGISQQFPTRSK